MIIYIYIQSCLIHALMFDLINIYIYILYHDQAREKLFFSEYPLTIGFLKKLLDFQTIEGDVPPCQSLLSLTP